MNGLPRLRRILLLAAILSWQAVIAGDGGSDLRLDREILELLALLETGQVDDATHFSQQLYEKYPGSRAVQLIFADLQNSLAFRRASMDARESYSRQMLEILNELKARKQHAGLALADGAIPDNIIQAAPETRHIIAVDLSRSRLYLLERTDADDAFRLQEDHYVSVGLGGVGKTDEGDLKTPVGIYRIDGFKNDEALPELYGSGAFTLDFPNGLDRQRGISGSGIWLHGMPHDQLSRPPQTSEGCVVMRNALVTHLLNTIDLDSTPVILAESLSWSNPPFETTSLDSLLERINRHPPPLKIAGNAVSESPETDQHTMFQEFAERQLRPQDLEIFRYPLTTPPDSTESLYRVRFLHQSTVEDEHDQAMQTQYWRHVSGSSWELIFESLDER